MVPEVFIPKLKVEDPDADAIDELLDSVDLSSYGLQRVSLTTALNLVTKKRSLILKIRTHVGRMAVKKKLTRWMKSFAHLMNDGSKAGVPHLKSKRLSS